MLSIILDDEDDDDDGHGDGDIDGVDDDDDDDNDIHCDNFVPSCSGDDDGDGGNDTFFPCDSGGGVHGEDSWVGWGERELSQLRGEGVESVEGRGAGTFLLVPSVFFM